MIANADMAVERGDIDGALSILKSISPNQQYVYFPFRLF
jgi:hypothetical protein